MLTATELDDRATNDAYLTDDVRDRVAADMASTPAEPPYPTREELAESNAAANIRMDAVGRESARAAIARGHRAATGDEPDGTVFTYHVNAAFKDFGTPKYIMARRSDGVPALYRGPEIGCGIDSEFLLDRLHFWTVDPADAWVDVAYVRKQYEESANAYRQRHGITEPYRSWKFMPTD